MFDCLFIFIGNFLFHSKSIKLNCFRLLFMFFLEIVHLVRYESSSHYAYPVRECKNRGEIPMSTGDDTCKCCENICFHGMWNGGNSPLPPNEYYSFNFLNAPAFSRMQYACDIWHNMGKYCISLIVRIVILQTLSKLL